MGLPMPSVITRAQRWWKNVAPDPVGGALMLAGFLYAAFLVQGLPLWDDDFTSWFWKIKDQSIWTTLGQWLSPISTQPEYWGFNERPVQALVYQIGYIISGYEAWSYFLYKSLVFAALGYMAYLWGQRLMPASSRGAARGGALAGAVLLLLAPGTAASHVIHSDLATTAELWFLILTYWIFAEIEKTPVAWRGWPSLEQAAQRAWLKRWFVISLCVYLAYKSKADLKLIPGILALYILIVRRHQLRFFAWPVGWMVLLAIPWGGKIFGQLPPFVPGSQGSEIGWMWQPASVSRLLDFFWTPGPYEPGSALREPTLSLAGVLGPYLLAGLLAFGLWLRRRGGWRLPLTSLVRPTKPEARARVFALVWFLCVAVGISALPGINYLFRIRYGLLPMVPVSLLLAWGIGRFIEAAQKREKSGRLPRWAVALGVVLFSIQASANLARSIKYRRDLGQVMVAVDQVYAAVGERYPTDPLALLPDFRPYDYRPGGPPAVLARVWLTDLAELAKFPAGKTSVISWRPSLWQGLEVVDRLPGCRSGVLFDWLFPCAPGSGAVLMRYLGEDPLYKKAEETRARGDGPTARKLHEEFLAKHPKSLASLFVAGLLAYQAEDWRRADQAFAQIEEYLPDHLAVLYNHALTLGQLKRYPEAIRRLEFVTTREPDNYGAQVNLYSTYVQAGEPERAREKIRELRTRFPNDQGIARLAGTGG